MHEHDCSCEVCSILRDMEKHIGLSPSMMLAELRAEAEQVINEQRSTGRSNGRSMSREQWRAQAAKRGYHLIEVETGIAALSPEDIAWLKAQHISL